MHWYKQLTGNTGFTGLIEPASAFTTEFGTGLVISTAIRTNASPNLAAAFTAKFCTGLQFCPATGAFEQGHRGPAIAAKFPLCYRLAALRTYNLLAGYITFINRSSSSLLPDLFHQPLGTGLGYHCVGPRGAFHTKAFIVVEVCITNPSLAAVAAVKMPFGFIHGLCKGGFVLLAPGGRHAFKLLPQYIASPVQTVGQLV